MKDKIPKGCTMGWSGPLDTIPDGWVIMDGKANAKPVGSGVDLRGFSNSGDPDEKAIEKL